jgi:hypothetical protein
MEALAAVCKKYALPWKLYRALHNPLKSADASPEEKRVEGKVIIAECREVKPQVVFLAAPCGIPVGA